MEAMSQSESEERAPTAGEGEGPRLKPRRRRKVALKAAILLISLAGALLVAEFFASRVLSRPGPRTVEAHFRQPQLIYNSLGFRDFEYPEEKLPKQFRIFAVGDSFTQGGGVNFDDTYPKKLERYLNYMGNIEKITYQVMNLGVPGRSTNQEVELIKEQAVKFDPDLIILGYCLNDAENRGGMNEVNAMRDRLTVRHFQKGSGLAGFLYDRSALYRLISHRAFNYRTFRGQIQYYQWLYQEEYSGWRLTREALRELGEFSLSEGIPVIVMIFPLFSFGLDETYPFKDIHGRLHEVLDTAQLSWIDLFDVYSGLDRNILETVPFDDAHPSDTAHRIAAEVLWHHLISEKLVPSDRDLTYPKKGRNVPSPFVGNFFSRGRFFRKQDHP
jgi:hypothetical protein